MSGAASPRWATWAAPGNWCGRVEPRRRRPIRWRRTERKMPVIVNGVELTDAELERELPHHADADNPQRRAMTALVLRRVLLDEAQRLGLAAEDEDAAIDAQIGRAHV